jgi:hypothetical protein
MPDGAKNPPTGGRDPKRNDQACGLIRDVIAQRAHVKTSVPHLCRGHARESDQARAWCVGTLETSPGRSLTVAGFGLGSICGPMLAFGVTSGVWLFFGFSFRAPIFAHFLDLKPRKACDFPESQENSLKKPEKQNPHFVPKFNYSLQKTIRFLQTVFLKLIR